MTLQSSFDAQVLRRAPVEKLIEYRTAHFSSHSEAATYYTNHPAQVQFRFANPIICRLTSGHKVMRVGGSKPFGFDVGDALYVPPCAEIDVDLRAASPANPIECDCFEIEAGRMDSILAGLNESLSADGAETSVALDWTRFAVFRGVEADSLNLGSLMNMFQGEQDIFANARIEARINEMVLTLLHLRSGDLLTFNPVEESNHGVVAAARLIRDELGQHLTSDALANAACMSSSTLYRQFQKHFGTTPRKFASQLRIAEAKRRLRMGTEPISDIAEGLAFSDTSHFTRVFRKSVGDTPAEYRRRREQHFFNHS